MSTNTDHGAGFSCREVPKEALVQDFQSSLERFGKSCFVMEPE
jgi:hypothetical protein